MLNLAKIKTKVKHPMLNDDDYVSALEDRGLISSEEFNVETDMKALELTIADMLVTTCDFPDITEGGMRFGKPEKALSIKRASGIYSKWNVQDPNKPTARFISMG